MGIPVYQDWFERARALPENEGVSDNALIDLYVSRYVLGGETAPEPKPERTERTWGEALSDTGAGFMRGGAKAVETIGDLGQLATGKENALQEAGASAADFWQDKKSDILKSKEQGLAERMQAANGDGLLQQFWAGIYETAKDPALLSNFIAENAALMAVSGGAGRAAGIGAKALGAGKAAAGTVATAGAVGSGAALQGADVGSDTLERLQGLPVSVWEQNPDYQALRKAGLDEKEAINEISLGLARTSGAAAGAASLASQFLIPGGAGTTIERVLAGAGGKAISAGGLKEVAKQATRAFFGEGAQEAIEEGSGQFGSNLAVRDVNAEQSLTEGVGTAAGQGFVLGGALGGPAGAVEGVQNNAVFKQAEEVRRLREASDKIASASDTATMRAAAAEVLLKDIQNPALPAPTTVMSETATGLTPNMVATAEGLRPERPTDLVGLPDERIATARFETPAGAADAAGVLNAAANATPDSTAPDSGMAAAAPAQSVMTETGTYAVERTDLTKAAARVSNMIGAVNNTIAAAITKLRSKVDANGQPDAKAQAEAARLESLGAFNAKPAPHETVKGGSTAVGFGRFFKVDVQFFTTDSKLAPNGMVTTNPDGGRTIFINARSKFPVMEVFGHEITHVFERDAIAAGKPELYKEFVEAMRPFLPEGMEGKIGAKYGELGDATKESVADLSGSVWTNESFYEKLANEKPEVFSRVVAAIKKFIATFRAALSSGTVPMVKEAVEQVDKVEAIVAKYAAKHQEIAPAAEAARAADRAARTYADRQVQEPAAEERSREMAGEAMVAAAGNGAIPKVDEEAEFAIYGRALTQAERERVQAESRTPEARAARAEARARQEAAIAERSTHHAARQPRNDDGTFALGEPEPVRRPEPRAGSDRPLRGEFEANEALAQRARPDGKPTNWQQRGGFSGGANFSLASRDDFTRENIEGITQKDGWAILTAENPNNAEQSDEKNIASTKELRDRLRSADIDYIEVRGRYSEGERPEERSFIIFADKQRAMALGVEFGQESILTREGLVYQSGKVDKATGKVNVFDKVPENYYTRIPGEPWAFSVDIDFSLAEAAEPDAETYVEPKRKRKGEAPNTTSRFADAPGKITDGKTISVRYATKPTIREADPDVEPMHMGLKAALRGGLEKGLARSIRHMAGIRIDGRLSDRRLIESFVSQMTDNLKWLYGRVPEAVREKTRQWYVGANKYANDLAESYGVTDMQAAAVIARLSPQNDWFNNIWQAREVISFFTDKVRRQHRWDPRMEAKARSLFTQTGARVISDTVIENLKGQSFDTLVNDVDRGWFLRIHSETYSDRTVHEMSPDGKIGKVATNDDGSPVQAHWNSVRDIALALAMLADGSHASISRSMGAKHKIRSFYNNIVSPNDAFPNHVTIDTHAVAAAHVMPMSSESFEVKQAFGGSTTGSGVPVSGVSGITGVDGTYPLYHEAYVRAAKDLGVLPRELQSITWEAVREMFPAAIKDSMRAPVSSVWMRYTEGNITAEQAREGIWEIVDEYASRRSDQRVAEGEQAGADAGELGGGELGQEPGGADAGGAGRGAGAVSEGVGLDFDVPFSLGSAEPAVRPGREGSVSAVGIHFGNAPNLPALSGARFGSGIKGAEQARLAQSEDPRIKRRIYFYVKGNEPFDVKRREHGLGTHAYRADLGNLYEPGVSPNIPRTPVYSNEEFKIVDQAATSNRWESAVLDAGYDGYIIRKPDIAVVMNKDVRVQYLGQLGQGQRIEFSLDVNAAFADDMQRQSEFLSERAREAGHANADEFLQRDFDGFVRAAEEWRATNPSAMLSIDDDFESIDYDDIPLPAEDPDSYSTAISKDLARFREDRPLTDDDYRSIGADWFRLAADPNAFTFPISEATELEDVAREMGGDKVEVDMVRLDAEDVTYYSDTGFKPVRSYLIDLNYKATAGRVYEDARGRLALNVSFLKQGKSLGSLIYQIVGTWAANSGRVFIGDPAGLSNRALFRRTAQMMSNALRTGSTKHLEPHPYQTEAGLQWRKGDDDFNVGQMAVWIRDTIALYDPEGYFADDTDAARRAGEQWTVAPVDRETATGGQRTRSQVAITDEFLSGLVGIEGRGEGEGVGVRPALRADGANVRELVGGALYSLAEGYAEPELNEAVAAYARRSDKDYIKVFDRLPVLQMVGQAENMRGLSQGVVLTSTAVNHIGKNHPDMTPEVIARAVSSLDEPRAVVINKDPEKGDSVVVVTKYRDNQDRPVLVALRGRKENRLSIATILTTFPKNNSADWVAEALQKGRVAYADERERGRLAQLLRRVLLPLAGRGGRGNLPRGAGPNLTPRTQYTTLSNANLEAYRKGDSGWNKGKLAVEPAKVDTLGAIFSISGNSARSYTPEQREMFKRTGRDVQKPSIKQRIEALNGEVWGILRQGLFDQFDPIKKISGKAYALMRLSRGSSGAVEALLKHGLLDIEDGVTTSRNDGGFIDRVGAALQGEMDDFLWWIASNRAEQLTREERERLFTAEDIAAGKSLSDGEMRGDYVLQHGPRKGQTTRNRAEVYADALKTYNEFSRNVLDIAEQSGLIDGESRQHWERGFYVPFYRESEERGFIGANIKNGAVRQKAFERLKGGKQKLNNDLLSNVLLNWAHLIDASAKNRAALAAAVAAVDAGVAIESDEAAIRDMGRTLERRDQTFWVMDGGRKRYFLVEDRPLMEALVGLEYAGMRNPIMDALTKLKHWLTIGVTASPGFKIRNLIRDSVQAIAVSDLSYNPFSNVAEGYRAGARGGKQYADALASGALIRFGTMVEGSHAERTRQLMKLGMKASHLLDSESKVRLFWDRVVEPALTAYNELGNRGEEVNRMALYNQLLKQGVGKAEAALMARDLMDFSMQGKFHWVRFLTQIVPFLNARLQGLYKLGRGTAENPKKAGVVIAAVATLSLALLAAYHDDPEWKKREDWDRDNYWWFKFGGVAYRIPKPFEIGAIGTIAERGAELFFDPEQTGGNATKQVMKIITDQLSISAIPQAVKPILDIYSNKDSFTGRPIESMSDEKLRPDYRFNSSNSMLARGISTAGQGVLRATGLESMGYNFLSPKQIDHAIRGYTAWLGTTAVATTDIVLRPLSGQVERPDPDHWRKYSLGFLQSLPSDQSRYVTRVYDQLAVVEEAYGTYRNLVKEGRAKEAAEFMAENREEIAKYKSAVEIRAALTKLNQQAKIIERSNLSGEEKRRRLSEIAKRRDTISRTLK